MVTLHLFTKADCAKCAWIEDHINGSTPYPLRVHLLDEDNPIPLGLLAYYEAVGIAEKNIPLLVVDDDESRSRRILTELPEIAEQLGIEANIDDGDNECIGSACAL